MSTPSSHNKSGFTIMETLVAISLLLLAITGPMVFAQNGLRAAFQSRDQVTAFYLAQDAVEFIKNRRDHNVLNRTPENWLEDIDMCASGENRTGGCSLDTSYVSGNIIECSFESSVDTGCLGDEEDGTEDVPLKIGDEGDDDEGIIGHIGDTNSIFSRTVYVDQISTDEAKVTVIVRWRSHANIGTREVQLVEYVYNWASALGI